jgi:hypothetical protein
MMKLCYTVNVAPAGQLAIFEDRVVIKAANKAALWTKLHAMPAPTEPTNYFVRGEATYRNLSGAILGRLVHNVDGSWTTVGR